MKSSEQYPLLLNCSFFSKSEYITKIEQALRENCLTHIVTLNAEMVVEAQGNKEFRYAVERAELKIPDGSSILWARNYLNGSHTSVFASLVTFLFSKEQPLTGVDSIFDICEVAQRNKGTVCLIGGKDDEAKKTVEVLQKKYPGLTIEQSSPEKLPSLKTPIVVFVALGAPKQTLYIEQNRKAFEDAGVKIAIGVGGAFAMIAGTLPRAPYTLRRFHLEWLWRLLLEPSRIKRIWNAVVVFPRIVHGYPH